MLSLKKYVQNVYIGSPTTDAIHKFAQKFGLEYDSRYTRYIVK